MQHEGEPSDKSTEKLEKQKKKKPNKARIKGSRTQMHNLNSCLGSRMDVTSPTHSLRDLAFNACFPLLFLKLPLLDSLYN